MGDCGLFLRQLDVGPILGSEPRSPSAHNPRYVKLDHNVDLDAGAEE